jgi:hypothetical protein
MKKIPFVCLMLGVMLSAASAQEIKVWKKVWVGLYQNTDEVRENYRYNRKYVQLNRAADSILSQGPIAFAPAQKTVTVAMVCGEDLGFAKDVSYETLCKAAQTRGLVPCSAEVALQLRLIYDEQPLGDWQYIAMDPIEYDDGTSPSVKSVLALVNTDTYFNAVIAIEPLTSKIIPNQRQFVFQLK